MSFTSKSTRSAMGLHNLWTTDKGAFPVVIIASFAAVAGTFTITRSLMSSPDVCLDKSKRGNGMHHSSDAGSDWRARRFRFANSTRNPINQSRQFDELFAKGENKGVER
ncbi:hypothetical protein PybrP1_008684 [[Pythium] brassicae (nom. inval.)]|nr:hypothetical protein PybrP1_008684 [[Pythium] brassicae (nom. inval.)]